MVGGSWVRYCGDADGFIDTDGAKLMVGEADGEAEGCVVGASVGDMVGSTDGDALGG